jgi:hypothetical protein
MRKNKRFEGDCASPLMRKDLDALGKALSSTMAKDLKPTSCTCYVADLDAETQFCLRWGAHGFECPRYRRSLDPVDDANDQDYRATHS